MAGNFYKSHHCLRLLLRFNRTMDALKMSYVLCLYHTVFVIFSSFALNQVSAYIQTPVSVFV